MDVKPLLAILATSVNMAGPDLHVRSLLYGVYVMAHCDVEVPTENACL